MTFPPAKPAHGSDETATKNTNSTSTLGMHHIPFSSIDSQKYQEDDNPISFPEIYRKTVTDALPHNYGKSDALDSSFMDQWSSNSLPEDDIDIDATMRNRKPMEEDDSPSSGLGSGDVLSDEDRERLGSIQRGENTAVVGWLKNLGGNHTYRQGQSDPKARSGLDKHKQPYACSHHRSQRGNGPKNSHRMNCNDRKPADDCFELSGFEDSNNTQYDGMDSATGPCINSSEASTTTSSNSSDIGDDAIIKESTSFNRNARKRACEDGIPACSDIIENLTIRNKQLKKRLKQLEDLYLGHRVPATSELFEVRYFSMPQQKKRELESYLREFATHIHLDNPSGESKSGTSSLSSAGAIDQSPQSAMNGVLQYSSLTSHAPPNGSSDTQIQPSIETLSQAQICEVSSAVEAILTKPTLVQRDILRNNSIDGWLPIRSLYEASSDLNDSNISVSYLQHCLRRGSRHLELSKDQTRVRLKHVVMTGDSNKDTGSDSTESSFSGKNAYGSTFWALRTDFPQKQDKVNISSSPMEPVASSNEENSTFRPYTPCFSSRNVVSSMSSRGESDPTRRGIDWSNWCSDDPLTGLTGPKDTNDNRAEKDKQQSHIQQLQISFNKQQRTQQRPAGVAKGARIIYVEGGTFCLDLSRSQKPHESGPEEEDVPEYVRDSEVVLGGDWDESSKWQDLFCWNCESKSHTFRDCSQKSDHSILCKNALEYARRYPDRQSNFRRYFDETELRQRVEDMVVGNPSNELKEALGVTKDELIMPYYNNMFNYCYPPGWKGVVRRDTHKQGSNIHKNPSNGEGKLNVWINGRLVQISAYDSDSVDSMPDADIAKAGEHDSPRRFRGGTSKPVMDGKIGAHYQASVGAQLRAKYSKEPRIKLVDYPGLRWRSEEFKPTDESQTSRADSGHGSSNAGSEISFNGSKHKNLPKAGKIVSATARAEDASMDVS